MMPDPRALLQRLREIVNAQAEDGGLWFHAETAPEAYLQCALRRLHAEIEQAADVSVNLNEDLLK